MKIYCGTDIIEIERIKESIEDKKMGKAFVKRVYTSKEIEYCESKKAQKYQHYAARFAAKEATFKAISEQIDDKYSITWKDIEVINNEQGRPQLNLMGMDLKNIEDIDLSLSHCKEYAVANVTLLRK
ncbi:MAG TPA: holo-[acyl-carrier-protein] synthase [Firmicutes bacterium]|nr:holo-[acyl-carrier-protein] synthase [Bacillota bacterium]